MRDLLKDLNDRQRLAVTAPLGPVLVLAGAGSGKTRVLTRRIAYLIKKGLYKPEELLALTFTNKAAGEMRERIERIVEVRGGITMGTFHSVCARLLRQDIHELRKGYDRNFVIYDSDDSLRVCKQIVLEQGLSSMKPQVFAYYISAAKNKLTDPRHLNLDSDYLMTSLQQVYHAYQKTLQENNALDFDDLLKLTYELLVSSPKVLKKYQARFRCVLVDEYQDTNHAQYMLLKKLAGKKRDLFVVGDDAQSIYGFRGANMQNILNFKKDYPKARVIMLEQNYRSSQKILDAAHEVIKLNPFQYEKKLWTDNEEGSKVDLYEAGDEMDEAEFVVSRITNQEKTKELTYVSEETPILDHFFRKFSRPHSAIRNSNFEIPQNLKDFVILYRTHAQSRPFEEVLLQNGVPYQIVGGIKFYERKEIKDTIGFLRLLVNPRDLVSMARVINLPPRGIGSVSFRRIVKTLDKYGFSYERLYLNTDKMNLTGAAASAAKNFFETLYAAASFPANQSLPELMHLLLTRTGYKGSLLDGSAEGETRWENIQELFNVAAKFKHLPWNEGLRAFLEEVALMTDLDSMDDKQNRLTLMTLHSAKGLEFEKVFFVGLEEGLLPHSRSLLSPEELAEEIRLAYVGITRAKQHLYLSYARQRQVYGELRRCVPSRIIKAIPKRLLEKISN